MMQIGAVIHNTEILNTHYAKMKVLPLCNELKIDIEIAVKEGEKGSGIIVCVGTKTEEEAKEILHKLLEAQQ